MRAFRRLLPAALAASIACAAGAAQSSAAPPAAASAPAPGVSLHGHRFSVEIADTPATREHGLMDRSEMPRDHGMLFVFADAEPRTFWMKDTLIPLDMLFFDNAGRLVTILRDVPPCHADPCKVYASGKPARYVLELNAGTAARIGAREGDVLGISGLRSGTQ